MDRLTWTGDRFLAAPRFGRGGKPDGGNRDGRGNSPVPSRHRQRPRGGRANRRARQRVSGRRQGSPHGGGRRQAATGAATSEGEGFPFSLPIKTIAAGSGNVRSGAEKHTLIAEGRSEHTDSADTERGRAKSGDKPAGDKPAGDEPIPAGPSPCGPLAAFHVPCGRAGRHPASSACEGVALPARPRAPGVGTRSAFFPNEPGQATGPRKPGQGTGCSSDDPCFLRQRHANERSVRPAKCRRTTGSGDVPPSPVHECHRPAPACPVRHAPAAKHNRRRWPSGLRRRIGR